MHSLCLRFYRSNYAHGDACADDSRGDAQRRGPPATIHPASLTKLQVRKQGSNYVITADSVVAEARDGAESSRRTAVDGHGCHPVQFLVVVRLGRVLNVIEDQHLFGAPDQPHTPWAPAIPALSGAGTGTPVPLASRKKVVFTWMRAQSS